MGNIVADPARRWPKGVIPFQFDGGLDAYQSPFDIAAPVGVGGANRSADVKRVQELLNRFSPADGGPHPKLEVDGWIGPKTIAAIRKFQMTRFGWHDDRVDPGGPTIVELTIDDVDSTPDQAKGIILNAVHRWNRQIGDTVRWVRRTQRDANYVVFQQGQANRSKSLGMAGNGQVVEIEIGRARLLVARFGGTVEGVVIHEMGHAAGLGHEHQRSDRDQFVRILTANVARPCDFRKSPAPELNCGFPFTPCTPSGSYDYASTMHYFPTQASKAAGLATIEAIGADGNAVPRSMGSFGGLGPGDLAALRALVA